MGPVIIAVVADIVLVGAAVVIWRMFAGRIQAFVEDHAPTSFSRHR